MNSLFNLFKLTTFACVLVSISICKTSYAQLCDTGLTPDSEILSEVDQDLFENWLPSNLHYEAQLIYSTTTSAATPAAFHANCDGIPNTITVIKATNGYIFGGYNSGIWQSLANVYTGNLTDNFLFSVTSQTKNEWLRYPSNTIYNSSTYGPTFGGGHDLHVSFNAATNYSNVGHTYECAVGSYGSTTCRNSFSGSYNWTIETLEVWKLNTSGNPAFGDGDSDGDDVCDVDEVLGCTDNTACNFNTSATDSDICIYASGCDYCSGEIDGTGTVVDNDLNNNGICDQYQPCMTAGIFSNSAILSVEDQSLFMSWLPSDLLFHADLLYSSQNNGLSNATFHATCDLIPNTVTIVKATNGFIFGGYNEGFWHSVLSGYTPNLLNNFLFSVTSETTHDHYQNLGFSIYSRSNYGPTFGGGHDLFVNLDGGVGYSNIGYGYRCAVGTNGSSACRNDFSGDYNWTIESVEVWRLNSSGTPAFYVEDLNGNGLCDALEVSGCTECRACNFDPSATTNDGSCILPDGCTDSGACNYDGLAICDDGSCNYLFGCKEVSAYNYDPTAQCDNGSCIYIGCTDSRAGNYDPLADFDDGSCELKYGCTYEGSPNYNSDAIIDDGTCICDVCPGDFNGDGFVTVADLTGFLGKFGDSCN